MGVREHFRPLYRRWATSTTSTAKTSESYMDNSRRFYYNVPSIERQAKATSTPLSMVAEMRVRLISEGHRQYHSNNDGDGGDDKGQDVREQKTAFLRALDSSKARNSNAGERRNKSSNKNPSKSIRQTRNHKNNSEDDVIPRRRNNQSDSRTTTSATSKKLTLDEFFANLEKTKVNDTSSIPATEKRSRLRVTSKNVQQEKRGLRSQYDNSTGKSRSGGRAAPAADLGSFFDEVNALMDRNEQQEEEFNRTTTKRLTSEIKSLASSPTFRSSILDIIPPHASTTDTSLMNDGIASRREDRYSLRHNFSVESWDCYTELLDEVIEGPKFLTRFKSKKKKQISEDDVEKRRQIGQIVEWLRSEIPFVETHLSALDFALVGEIKDRNGDPGNDVKENGDKDQIINTMKGIHTSRSKLFREELDVQKERFLNEMGWTRKQYDVATGALVAMGSLCAKKCTAPPLDVAWSKLKELGYPMNNKDVMHNYLYVASTFSLPKQNSYIGIKNRENPGIFGCERIDDDDRDDGSSPSVLDFLNGTTHLSSSVGGDDNTGDDFDVSAEVALCHDFLHKATEQSTGIHVRRLVRLGKANEAERLLDATTKSDDLRLRTYDPIYQTYLDQGDVSSAFKLFAKMKESENVFLLTETYVQLIACIAENGYFRMEAREIDGIEDLPYSTKCGPDLLNILISELAEHSIEITSASAKRLYNAFQRGFRGDDPKMNLKQLNLLESLRTNNELAEPDELIVSRVRLDEFTGKCPRSRAQLRLINLDSLQKKRFQEALLHLVSLSYQERHRSSTKTDVAEKLKRFGEWLQNRDGKPITAIIDGPNIAYYMQNFQDGTFNFHQIKFVVDALENMGENVLVVLPKKYTYDRFSIPTQTVTQMLSPKEKDIRDDLIAKGKVYVVPVGSLDDYYWMYASVSMDEEFVPPDNPEGRWPGNRPMLISNDKLRDHKMSLLEPRLFRRWFSNFIINFTFSAFVNDECIDKELGFKTADFYSREIQGNSTNGNGTAWHFPVGDWDDNESLCIRIPR